MNITYADCIMQFWFDIPCTIVFMYNCFYVQLYFKHQHDCRVLLKLQKGEDKAQYID